MLLLFNILLNPHSIVHSIYIYIFIFGNLIYCLLISTACLIDPQTNFFYDINKFNGNSMECLPESIFYIFFFENIIIKYMKYFFISKRVFFQLFFYFTFSLCHARRINENSVSLNVINVNIQLFAHFLFCLFIVMPSFSFSML